MITAKASPSKPTKPLTIKILTEARAQNPKLKLVLMEPFVRHPGKPVPEGIVARQAIVAKLALKHGAALVRLQKLFDDAAAKTADDYWVWDSVSPHLPRPPTDGR
ncbi:hypothetical protein EMGBS6_15440 [Opitutia bacterium]|nr:hypothetical protein EMGBS6_15440 [Opitutae bacterium]